MAYDDPIKIHKEWLGYLQPVGLTVVPTAMVKAGMVVDTTLTAPHAHFLEAVGKWTFDEGDDPEPVIHDWATFAKALLDWQDRNLVREPEDLQLHLPDYQETLRPTYGVPSPMEEGAWMMLIQELDKGTPLDRPAPVEGHHWQATPQERFERLLRETQVPTGLLFNGSEARLVYAPKGETSGYLTFPVKAMCDTAGRLIFGAFRELLHSDRLFTAATEQWLPTILTESRKAQAEVSTALARQVLAALYELLRGFQNADAKAKGQILGTVLQEDPDRVYRGLLTVLLRLVFLKFAEERSLLSRHRTFLRHYSVAGLFERLREDYALFVDTMDQRYGAWAQLLVLFRLTYDGCDFRGEDGRLHLPTRHGYLFDPDRYPFLEGRTGGSTRQSGEPAQLPMVSDLVIYRVLEKLLILDGERIAYRGLDVEQIGSIYESMMGFSLHVATGPTVSIKSAKPHGAPACVNLEELLAVPGAKRKEWLQKATDQKLTGKAEEALKVAQNPEDLAVALAPKIDPEASPNRQSVPAGSLVLQPSPERRRSGSHYTPRTLTSRIVGKTLQPILQRLGVNPKPDEILALKILDPAVGSGAFLVETCRTLAELLVMAWRAHDCLPKLPPDEEPITHARRLVAQHCLYGVDRNPMAVDLAKLSLWLVTLAEDHPFTFLDHAIRHGDSLVGYHPDDFGTLLFGDTTSNDTFGVQRRIQASVEQAKGARKLIQDAPDDEAEEILHGYLRIFQDAVIDLELVGDALVHCFFLEEKPKARATQREQLWVKLQGCNSNAEIREALSPLQRGLRALGVHPFHWPLEFPEVFYRENPGFDAIVGNPPFITGRDIRGIEGKPYCDWLAEVHLESHGNADLVAHFYRMAFYLLREHGSFGLIATKTIYQGDTRNTGLRWIRLNQGVIYAAVRRIPWPGEASVVVSVVHIIKGLFQGPCELDGRMVDKITAFLFHSGPDEDPSRLEANARKSFQGSIVLGMGFTFDDTDTKGVANSLADRSRLITENPRNQERIFPYIGGEEINSDPEQRHHRYVINFEDFPLGRRDLEPSWKEANDRVRREYLSSGLVPLDYQDHVAEDWPKLLHLVCNKVMVERHKQSEEIQKYPWWRFWRPRADLVALTSSLSRILAISRHGQHGTFVFMPTGMVFSEATVVFAFTTYAAFAVLQAQPHDSWMRFLGSSMKDDLRYTPEDCFETFPFPQKFECHPALEAAGEACYHFRANLMIRTDLGLTKTYNRFHDPGEHDPDIQRLRDLHRAMDEAVLKVYGWSDLLPQLEYGFYPDFEPTEDEDGEPAKVRFRYRWPNQLREEVLGRLLDLNAKRAEEESLVRDSESASCTKAAKATSKRRQKPKPPPMPAGAALPF
jgi:hypothetical protein